MFYVKHRLVYSLIMSVTILVLSQSCGNNPEKKVGGFNIASEFLTTNQGKYSNFAGETLSLAQDGTAIQTKKTERKLKMIVKDKSWEFIDSILGENWIIPFNDDRLNPISPLSTQSFEIKFHCVYSRSGILSEFVAIPQRSKDFRYTWELEKYMSIKDVKFVAKFSFLNEVKSQFFLVNLNPTDTNNGENNKIDIENEQLFAQLQTACEKKRPQSYEFFQTLGITEYTDQKIETIPTAPNTYISASSQKSFYGNQLDQNIWLKVDSGSIDLSEKIWPHLKGRFFVSEKTYDRERNKYNDWSKKSPEEEISFFTQDKKQKLFWKRAKNQDLNECGFEVQISLEKFFLDLNRTKPAQFLFTQFKVDQVKIEANNEYNKIDNKINTSKIKCLLGNLLGEMIPSPIQKQGIDSSVEILIKINTLQENKKEITLLVRQEGRELESRSGFILWPDPPDTNTKEESLSPLLQQRKQGGFPQ